LQVKITGDDADLQKRRDKSIVALGYRYQYMPGGAGHDAALVAEQKKSSGKTMAEAMIFIPCKIASATQQRNSRR
jgi:hypothetical protein